MPCMEGGPSRQQLERDQRFHVAMARLACDHCRDLEVRGLPIPDWAMEWGAVHQADDRAREAELKHRRAVEGKRRIALSKLDPEDREALGIQP